MRKVREISSIFWVLLLVFAFSAVHASAEKTYPSNACASEKMKAAADRCDKVLKAWSRWAKTGKDASSQIGKADKTFDAKWASAEDKATKENVDCADMTLSSADMKTLMDAAIDDIVADATDGLNLGVKKDAICGGKLLKSAATMCQQLLKAESKLIAGLSSDLDGAKCDGKQTKATSRFGKQWGKTTRGACPTTATEAEIAGQVVALSEDVVTNITVSPNVPDDAYMAVTHPPGGEPGNEVDYERDTLVPQCQDGSAFTFFAKRGSENKLLMYYYGGGACWDTLTCVLGTCTQGVNPTPPGLDLGGFADLTDPDNPFKDWNVVHVPYCGCDVHWGDAGVDYMNLANPNQLAKHVEHRGHDNAKLVEKWAREHFLNPSDVFVTGSSAGSYGALMHGMPLSEVYPASSTNVMGDGGNGVITQEFLEDQFVNWGVEENLPDVPGIDDVPTSEQSMPDIIIAAASYYPGTNWANYTTAFDGGGGGQTGFYNVMLNPDNPIAAQLSWWEASCQFNEVMHQQVVDTVDAAEFDNDNYRYYIATGSRHTGFGSPRVYDDTTGGVPPLVDWVNAMIDDDPSWTNVEADPFNVLFPGDPKPDPLVAPFEADGPGPDADVVVNCP